MRNLLWNTETAAGACVSLRSPKAELGAEMLLVAIGPVERMPLNAWTRRPGVDGGGSTREIGRESQVGVSLPETRWVRELYRIARAMNLGGKGFDRGARTK